MSRLLSIPKAAEGSGIPYDTLIRLVHEAKVPAVKVPGRRAWLIDPDDVQAFIQSLKYGTNIGAIREVKELEVAASKGAKVRPKGSGSSIEKSHSTDWIERVRRSRGR